MNDKELVGLVVATMKVAEDAKSALERYRAEVQNRGLLVLKGRNSRYCHMHGTDGGYMAMSEPKEIDILNMPQLKQAIGEDVCTGLMTETTKTTYTLDRKPRKALKTIAANDYTFEYTLENYLKETSIPMSEGQKEVLTRGLKGDYEEDKKTLLSVLGCLGKGTTEEAAEVATPNLDIDLHCISRIKNTELIQAILSDEGTDWSMGEIKRSLVVISELKLEIAYEKEDR